MARRFCVCWEGGARSAACASNGFVARFSSPNSASSKPGYSRATVAPQTPPRRASFLQSERQRHADEITIETAVVEARIVEVDVPARALEVHGSVGVVDE